MSIWRLVVEEIAYRKADFALAVTAVLLAVGCLVGVSTLLRGHGDRLAELQARKSDETAAMMALAQDDYRKMMKTMGYNVIILSADEDLSEFWTNGFAAKSLPESIVARLCDSDIAALQHLLPQRGVVRLRRVPREPQPRALERHLRADVFSISSSRMTA